MYKGCVAREDALPWSEFFIQVNYFTFCSEYRFITLTEYSIFC
jgi:hypothetical protein